MNSNEGMLFIVIFFLPAQIVLSLLAGDVVISIQFNRQFEMQQQHLLRSYEREMFVLHCIPLYCIALYCIELGCVVLC